MKRGKFIAGIFASIPLLSFAKRKATVRMRTGNPFKVNAGAARFGTHYKMKGVTLNTLDIKISGKDTDNDLAVFEQTGQTRDGGPPLHIHIDQDEWFFVTEGEYLFQCGDENFI